MVSRQWFITGTGTDVGKTVISAALAHGLAQLGHSVTYWKPVQSGLPADLETVRQLAGAGVTYAPSDYVFQLPASPDQAAAAQGHGGVNLDLLAQGIGEHSSGCRLIEGAGGLLVPLNSRGETWADLLGLARLPVVVVAHSGLGTLNHTALTVEALQRRQIPIAAVVLNGPDHPANLASMKTMLKGIAILKFLERAELNRSPDWAQITLRLAQEFLEVPS